MSTAIKGPFTPDDFALMSHEAIAEVWNQLVADRDRLKMFLEEIARRELAYCAPEMLAWWAEEFKRIANEALNTESRVRSSDE